VKDGYAELLVILIIAAAAWGLYHLGYTTGKAESTVSLNKEADANDASQATIAKLQMSVAQCETDRLLDQNAELKAQADRDKRQLASDKSFEQLRATLAEKMRNECVDWAQQPACGSFP
jgi:Ser-tRNA(Ala) deacylase AlaX